jgi:hypothetical protein
MGLAQLSDADRRILIESRSTRDTIVAASEVLSTAQVLYRSWRAFDLGLGNLREIDLANIESVPPSASRLEARLEDHRENFVDAYATRVSGMVDSLRARGIEPILVTQPALFADIVDPTTGLAVGNLVSREVPAAERWQVLELYNDAIRRMGRERDILVVDLARDMPKDSALYLDWIHFTNKGAERVAEIIDRELGPLLLAREAKRR